VARRARSAELGITDREPHVVLSGRTGDLVSSTVWAFVPRRADFAFGLTGGVLVVASDVLAMDAAFSGHLWLRTSVFDFTKVTDVIAFTRVLHSVSIGVASNSSSIVGGIASVSSRTDELSSLSFRRVIV
jgi:hypothetical protein